MAALDAKSVTVGQELPSLRKGPISRDDLKAYGAEGHSARTH